MPPRRSLLVPHPHPSHCQAGAMLDILASGPHASRQHLSQSAAGRQIRFEAGHLVLPAADLVREIPIEAQARRQLALLVETSIFDGIASAGRQRLGLAAVTVLAGDAAPADRTIPPDDLGPASGHATGLAVLRDYSALVWRATATRMSASTGSLTDAAAQRHAEPHLSLSLRPVPLKLAPRFDPPGTASLPPFADPNLRLVAERGSRALTLTLGGVPLTDCRAADRLGVSPVHDQIRGMIRTFATAVRQVDATPLPDPVHPRDGGLPGETWPLALSWSSWDEAGFLAIRQRLDLVRQVLVFRHPELNDTRAGGIFTGRALTLGLLPATGGHEGFATEAAAVEARFRREVSPDLSAEAEAIFFTGDWTRDRFQAWLVAGAMPARSETPLLRQPIASTSLPASEMSAHAAMTLLARLRAMSCPIAPPGGAGLRLA